VSRARALAALAASLCLAASVSAQAQLFRTYLSPSGNDANPCTLPAPCRLLPAALAAVASGGEVWMLDSANYNVSTVTVPRSVTILAVPGAVGSVVAAGGPAISVTAAGLTVALRNLVIVPLPGGAGTNGVEITGSSTVTLENSLVANLPNDGVHVVGFGKVEITNSIIRNNFNYGVWLQDGGSAGISGSKLTQNGSGGLLALTANGNSTAHVSDSVISSPNYGVFAFATAAGTNARIFLTRCIIYNSSYAMLSQTNGAGAALVALNGITVTNNNTPWLIANTGAAIRTMGNNQFTDNTNPGNGSLTPAALQ
jgi:hypothetical protein